MLNSSIFNNPIDSSTKVWRYLSLSKFLHLISSRSIFFARIDQYDDPFEGKFSNEIADYLRSVYLKRFDDNIYVASESMHLIRALKYFVYASCWHKNLNESDAMWKLYSLVNEGVAIQTTVGRLSHELEKSKLPLKLAEINYVDYKDVNPMQFLDPISPYLHKRKSFAHEQEIRCILWKNPNFNINEERPSISFSADTPKSYLVPVSLEGLIENVIVSPMSPEWVYDLIRRYIELHNVNIDLHQSSLYSSKDFWDTQEMKFDNSLKQFLGNESTLSYILNPVPRE